MIALEIILYRKLIDSNLILVSKPICLLNKTKTRSQTIGPMVILSHARLDVWSHLVLPDWTFGPIQFLTKRNVMDPQYSALDFVLFLCAIFHAVHTVQFVQCSAFDIYYIIYVHCYHMCYISCC